MSIANSNQLMRRALRARTTIAGFNVPYLPMIEPIVRALKDTRAFGFVMVARLEWEKMGSGSLEAVAEEYARFRDDGFTRLHLDHVPVIDEDNVRVDYEALIRRALDAGYDSVMVDGSRLSFPENVAATRGVVAQAHARGIPVEAELGAVMGHEEGPLPPYEELFRSGKGFTDPDEARRFVAETGVDWLSVAVGSVHGAISRARKDERKVEARINIEHLARLREATGIPLVLHGGSGIRKDCVMAAIREGIAKINVGTAIRQPYERVLRDTGSTAAARDAVYDAMLHTIQDELEIAGTADILKPGEDTKHE